MTSPNSPIVQFATTPTTAELRSETGSKFIKQRGNDVSKQSHSAVRHDTDNCGVAHGNWSKFIYQRSDYLSKQSHSAIRHDTDYMRSYVGKLSTISSLKNTWQQSRGAIQHNTNPVLTQPQKRQIQGR